MPLLELAVIVFAESAAADSSGPIILTVIIALLGSGGVGCFLDRRSAQASRLAQDAVSATDVFQQSLQEERTRRAELTKQLEETKAQLAQSERNTERVAEPEARVTQLSNALAEAQLRQLNGQRP